MFQKAGINQYRGIYTRSGCMRLPEFKNNYGKTDEEEASRCIECRECDGTCPQLNDIKRS